MFILQSLKWINRWEIPLNFRSHNMVSQRARALCFDKGPHDFTYDDYDFNTTKYEKKRDPNAMRVCIVGAAGAFGSKLALQLKASPLVEELSLYDTSTKNYGVAIDLSHINTKCRVYQHQGKSQRQEALAGSKVVVICASDLPQRGMTVEDLFNTNAKIVEEIAIDCTVICPKACILVVSQPVDSLVPLVGQIFSDAGQNSKSQVIGVTASNVARATHILAQTISCGVRDIVVPVIGGHCENTIVPVFSACSPSQFVTDPTQLELCKVRLAAFQAAQPTEKMTKVIRSMAFLVKNWNSWAAGPTTSDHSGVHLGATTAACTTLNVLKGLKNTGEAVYDYGYVESDIIPGLKYSTVPLKFGPNGVEECFPVNLLTADEKTMLYSASLFLSPKHSKAKQFVYNSYLSRMNRRVGLNEI